MDKTIKTLTCSGCLKNIANKEYLVCCFCHKLYDLVCANVSEKRFHNTMSKDRKESWKCQECRNKERKGDNTDTPVRAARPDLSPDSDNSNVTVRRMEKRTKSSQPMLNPDDKLDLMANIREIIREEVNTVIKETVKEIINDQMKSIRELVTDFQNSISFFNDQYEKFKFEISEKNTTIKKLEDEAERMKKNHIDLKLQVDSLEQQLRAQNLEIHCVPESKSENLTTAVLQLSKTIGCEMKEEDITHSQRISKANPQSSRPRSILVKFKNQTNRDQFLHCTAKFNRANGSCKLDTHHLGIAADPPRRIFVVENLSPSNRALHFAARQRGRELNYKFVWVKSGRVYMRKTESSEYLHIRNLEQLQTLS